MPGRGRDKRIQGSDLPNMSPQERAGVVNLVKMGRAKVSGTAVVRDRDGNVKYDNPALAGRYNEDKL